MKDCNFNPFLMIIYKIMELIYKIKEERYSDSLL